eukprot:scaffold209160_cov50-Cyclotella_meneghiniana.AAC.2
MFSKELSASLSTVTASRLSPALASSQLHSHCCSDSKSLSLSHRSSAFGHFPPLSAAFICFGIHWFYS